MKVIELDVQSDYDGYFEAWTKKFIEELDNLGNEKISKVIVTSGPYRNYGMSYEKCGEILELDFYSAVRTGFGSIGCTPKELAEEILK